MFVDRDTVLDRLDAAIVAKGKDHIGTAIRDENALTTCSYWEYGPDSLPKYEDDSGLATPSCIVGHVIHDLGFDPAQIRPGTIYSAVDFEFSVLSTDGWGRTGENYLRNSDGDKLTFSAEAIATLKNVQGDQDSGVRWGIAVDKERIRLGL